MRVQRCAGGVAMSTTIVKGYIAIDYAEETGVVLNKHADPKEGARAGISIDEARRIAAEDPSLIWAEVSTRYEPGIEYSDDGSVLGYRRADGTLVEVGDGVVYSDGPREDWDYGTVLAICHDDGEIEIAWSNGERTRQRCEGLGIYINPSVARRVLNSAEASR